MAHETDGNCVLTVVDPTWEGTLSATVWAVRRSSLSESIRRGDAGGMAAGPGRQFLSLRP